MELVGQFSLKYTDADWTDMNGGGKMSGLREATKIDVSHYSNAHVSVKTPIDVSQLNRKCFGGWGCNGHHGYFLSLANGKDLEVSKEIYETMLPLWEDWIKPLSESKSPTGRYLHSIDAEPEE